MTYGEALGPGLAAMLYVAHRAAVNKVGDAQASILLDLGSGTGR